jgi:hypothetical protein
MVGYIFGGNTGVATPEELAYRRRAAQALIDSGTQGGSRNAIEGLGAIAKALSGSWAYNRISEREKEGKAGATDRFNALFQPKDADITPASYSPNEQTGAPGYRGIAKVMPQSDTGKWLNNQLANDPDLKLTPAAAAGITGNLDLETGGFKHMQEIKPMVPGSRGGYGWAQWTGPRRDQFEAWVKKQKGLDPASKEANFGFLKHELLNTPEGKVLASLQGVDDAGQAATIFSDQYLRPGIPHMDRRVAAAQGYAGGSPNIQPAGGAQPVRLAQAGGPSLRDMLQVYSDPWTTPEQRSILQMHIDREMQANDPLRKQQLEKGQLEIDALRNPKADLTDDMREYEAAKKQGFTGSFMDFMREIEKASAPNINLPGQSNIGTIPPGFEAVQDPNTGAWTMSPIPGGPSAAEVDAKKKAEDNRTSAEQKKAGLISQEIDRALNVMQTGILPDTGSGAMLSGIPGTDAKTLSGLFDTIKASIGFYELSKMRQQSPTGGALGNVTEKELAYLQALAGSLDQSQSAETLTDNLNRLWNAYQDVIHGPGNGPARRLLKFEQQLGNQGGGTDLKSKYGLE